MTGIQQFWLGQSVVFGCLDCHEAAHTREGIDHADDCSHDSDDGLRADGSGEPGRVCTGCGVRWRIGSKCPLCGGEVVADD